MIITISEDLRIASDVHCWTLQRKRTKNGKPKFEPYQYFTSLRQALEAACEQEVRADPARTLEDAAAAICQIVTRYERLFDCALAKVSAQQRTQLRAVS